MFNSVVICSFFDILVFVFAVADYLRIVVLSVVCWFAGWIVVGLLVYCSGLWWVSSLVWVFLGLCLYGYSLLLAFGVLVLCGVVFYLRGLVACLDFGICCAWVWVFTCCWFGWCGCWVAL